MKLSLRKRRLCQQSVTYLGHHAHTLHYDAAMLQSLKIIAGLLLLGYGAICLLLFLGQRSLIYHPQPRSVSAVPLMQMVSGEVQLNVSHAPRASAQAVIYFGGNAEDVSASLPQLAAAFPQAAVYALHYRGYGGSQGQPSEAALFADGLALHAAVAQKHAQIIVIGRSLGSGVAVYVASRRAVQRVVLVTPYSSIADVAAAQFPWIPVRWLLKDPFDSVQHVANVKAPVRIVAAQRDEVIPAWSTQKLFEAIPAALRSQHVMTGAGHNDLSQFPEYAKLLNQP